MSDFNNKKINFITPQDIVQRLMNNYIVDQFIGYLGGKKADSITLKGTAYPSFHKLNFKWGTWEVSYKVYISSEENKDKVLKIAQEAMNNFPKLSQEILWD